MSAGSASVEVGRWRCARTDCRERILVRLGRRRQLRRPAPRNPHAHNFARLQFTALANNFGIAASIAPGYVGKGDERRGRLINQRELSEDLCRRRGLLLGNGELKGKYSFKVNAVSEKAKAAIEASGGSVEIVK